MKHFIVVQDETAINLSFYFTKYTIKFQHTCPPPPPPIKKNKNAVNILEVEECSFTTEYVQKLKTEWQTV